MYFFKYDNHSLIVFKKKIFIVRIIYCKNLNLLRILRI